MEGNLIDSLLVASEFTGTFAKLRSNGDKMGDNERSKSRPLRFTVFEIAAVGRERHCYLDCLPASCDAGKRPEERIEGIENRGCLVCGVLTNKLYSDLQRACI